MPIKLAEVHVQQSTQVSCVAACVCMVRRRRGERIDEQAILEEWGSGGPFSLTLHARDLGILTIRQNGSIRSHARAAACCVVFCAMAAG
jgi:hypothetical protein